jgi:hypothetical protein
MNRLVWFLGLALGAALLVYAPLPSEDQDSSTAPEAKEKVPLMDGEAGPCSLELSVLDPDGKPIYAATVKVHIAYGLGGIRKLDLEAGTNSHGAVKFTGLPARVHRPPLEFRATKDQLAGVARFDPSVECEAKRNLPMQQPAR